MKLDSNVGHFIMGLAIAMSAIYVAIIVSIIYFTWGLALWE